MKDKQTFLIKFNLMYKCVLINMQRNIPSPDTTNISAPPASAQPLLSDQPMHVHSEISLLQSLGLTLMEGGQWKGA